MNPDIITHYGRVRVTFAVTNRTERPSAYTQRTMYVNNLSQEVKVRLRSGMVMSFPATPGRLRQAGRDGGPHEFVVKRELVITREGWQHAANFLGGVTEKHSTELQTLRDVFLQHYNSAGGMQNEIRCQFEYFFTEEEIKSVGGVFYHHELDALYNFGDKVEIPEHPHCQVAQKAGMMEQAMNTQEKLGFVFSVEIIDSLSKYGDRYLNICNQIYKISAKKDNNKPDGIYIVSSKPTVGRMATEELCIECYQFDEAEKQLGLYKTFEQARTQGDPALTRKLELEAMEHETQVLKREAQMEKLRADQLAAERDQKVKDLEYERNTHAREIEDLRTRQDYLIEMEKLRMKDFYERRSSDRKDTTELIKYVPMILAAVGTVLMAVKTFKTVAPS